MTSRKITSWMLSVLLVFALSLVTSLAAAAGRVQWGKTSIKEGEATKNAPPPPAPPPDKKP